MSVLEGRGVAGCGVAGSLWVRVARLEGRVVGWVVVRLGCCELVRLAR